MSRGKIIFIVIIFIKLFFLLFFSSDYQNKLFVPFIEHFLANLDNPWQYFYSLAADKFPYPPLMLYIVSLFYLLCYLLFANITILQNLFFKLPILASDILIAYTLFKIFPNKRKEILIFYFASPIILYASYMHSLLDLIPLAILVFSIFLLTVNRLFLSSVIFGFALSTKLHLILVLPLILIYIGKNYKKKYILYFIFTPLITYLFFTFPYLFSPGYSSMVLCNPKQMMVFDLFYPLGDLKIYIPIFAAFALYIRFFGYDKVNKDLFYAFINILFSAFVLLVFPAYSWYVWMVPFLSLFFIEQYEKHPKIIYLYIALNVVYLIFFIFFYIPEYRDLIFLRTPLNLKIVDSRLTNLTYTLFEVVLCAILYSLYKFGVRSNSIYKKAHNFIIGIGGDSAAGKNTLVSDIKLLLGDRLLQIEGDADHKWERGDDSWQIFTHLDPKANYLHRQAQDLFFLKFGRNVTRGDYDHQVGSFTPFRKITPKEFVILSGLHVFYLPKARKVIDFKIYLDTEERLRWHWKMVRDIKERGYSKEKSLEQIEKRLDDAKKFVHPQKEFADLIISYFTEDKFEVGSLNFNPKLNVKISMDSSIHLEGLVKKLMDEKIDVSWDYADDLKSQFIIVRQASTKELIVRIAKEIIPNIEELIAQDATWLEGYRGIVQLTVMVALSEMMREKINGEEI